MSRNLLRGALAAALLLPSPLLAQDSAEGAATSEEGDLFAPEEAPAPEPTEEALAALAMMDGALKEIDDTIERDGNTWQFQLGERLIIIITDPIAERMRIMTPIASADVLPAEVSMRLLQANYDSALDARYAVAQNILWGVFIHNLTGLDKSEFQSGLLQTINVGDSFGTTYSSGAAVFGGGDSSAIIQKQLEELLEDEEARGAV